MARDARARVKWQGRESTGKALLESDILVFRGDFRLLIPIKDITSVRAELGTLYLAWHAKTGAKGADSATFDLDDEAEVWAERIRSPKPLIDKLGVKVGARVVLLGVRDERFLEELETRTELVAQRIGEPADLIFYVAETLKRLEKLPDLAKAIKKDGAVWVVHPKGRHDLKDVDVIAAGRAAGLVDNKVVRFSDTHSALRFVVPLAKR